MRRILDNSELIKRNKKNKRKKIILFGSFFILFLLFLFYCFGYNSTRFFIQKDDYKHVSWVVVLDGQTADLERTDYALKLLETGKADSMLILGRRVFKDKSNADFYFENLATENTVDSSKIFLFRHNDPSTLEEAVSIIPWLKERNADTVLLLTSSLATRRAASIFNTLSGKRPVFITDVVPYYNFNSDFWITSREMKKVFVREVLAFIQSRFDLLFMDTLVVEKERIKEILSVQEEYKNLFSKETIQAKELQKNETSLIKTKETHDSVLIPLESLK